MNIIHKLEMRENTLQNVVYVYYPTEYEFGLDFDKIKTRIVGVAEKIREFAVDNISKFTNETVLLILNGVVVGTVMLTQLVTNTGTETINKTKVPSVLETKIQNVQTNPKDLKISNEKPTIKTDTVNSINTSNLIYNNSNTIIPLKLQNGNIIQIGINDYLIGVVASEMPIDFNIESLKSQAVVSRTYTLRKNSAGIVLEENSKIQKYMSEKELKEIWNDSFNNYYTKIKNAVFSTSNEVLMYNNKLASTPYFLVSNGKTEDSINVWGDSTPYLKSVDSKFDITSKDYSSQKVIPKQDFCKKLNIEESSLKNIEITAKTIGDRISKISINRQIFDGSQIQKLLDLNSADFTITLSDNNVIIDVRGNGHGVGMSKYGANMLANKGYNYKEILNYYYKGTNIEKI